MVAELSIVEKFFRIHLRQIKRFNNVQLLSLSAKSTFKIPRLGDNWIRFEKRFLKIIKFLHNTLFSV